jgi:hypothetical protein
MIDGGSEGRVLAYNYLDLSFEYIKELSEKFP